MKKFITYITVFLFSLTLFSNAENLSEQDEQKLLAETLVFFDSIDHMKVNAIADYTYPQIFKLAGNKKMFTEKLKEMRKYHLEDGGFNVTSSSLGKPSSIIKMGNEEVVFVPRNCVIDFEDSILTKITYVIAIRGLSSESSWKFIDGDFFGPEPKAMFNLLTKLPKNTKLPFKKSKYTDKVVLKKEK